MRLRVGRLQKARGLRGELHFLLFLPDPKAFGASRVFVGAREYRVARASFQDSARGILTLDGVTDRNAADALVGQILEIDPAWWSSDWPLCALAGAKVVHASTGEPIGEVEGVDHNGAQVVLQLRTATGEALVPCVDALVPRIERRAGELVVHLAPIPGLLAEET